MIEVFIIMVLVVMFTFVLLFHVRFMLFIKLITEVDVVIDPVVIDRSRTEKVVVVEIEGEIDVI